MRPLYLLLFPLLAGCYPHLVPTDPVADPPVSYLGEPALSGATYGVERTTDTPVLPFRLWGLDFDEEVLFELAHDDTYAMVEVTRAIGREGGEVFFALVAEQNGLQHVIVGDDVALNLAETFPAPVHDGKLRVVRLEGTRNVEYDVAFYLPDGRLLQAHITANKEGKEFPQRVGNAMNHSADRVLAVLDLEAYNWGRAAVFLDEKRVPVRHLAVVAPFVWRLEQTAGGLSYGGVNVTVEGEGLLAHLDDVEEPIPFRRESHGDETWFVGEDRVIDHVFRYRRPPATPDALELIAVEVRHGDVSVIDFAFNPALPDLRYPVDRVFESRWVAGSNGRDGYARGVARVHTVEGRTTVDIVPEVPFWSCERPMRSRFQFLEDKVRLRAEVTPSLAAGGLGRDACYEYDKAWRKDNR
jgi:hypothetical protein